MGLKIMTLTWGVHQALIDFRWLSENLSRCSARLCELVPLQSTLGGYLDASGYMCGGSVLPRPTVVPRTPQNQPSTVSTSLQPVGAHPIVWQDHFPTEITAQLVLRDNPEGQVTNSYLKVVGSLIHHTCMTDYFNIGERTTMSSIDNTPGLWCQSEGSETSTFTPAHLLCLQAIHQRFHCYVPHHNFLNKVDNGFSNRPSCSRDLTNATLRMSGSIPRCPLRSHSLVGI